MAPHERGRRRANGFFAAAGLVLSLMLLRRRFVRAGGGPSAAQVTLAAQDAYDRLLHPSHEVSKEYRVTVSGPVEHAAERLSRVRDVVGLPIRPAEVRELSRKGNRAELSVIIHEGRNRQIRRMCAQCELEVLRLQRVREHCLELGALPLGQWRYLTAEEIAGLKEE